MWPVIAQIVIRVFYAGMYLTNKVALTRGMNSFIYVTYRAALATLALAPFTYFAERKIRPPSGLKQTWHMFLLGLLGITVTQNCYILGLYYTSSTFSATVSNLIPVAVFIVSIILRMEKVDLRKITGQGKIVGTLVCLAGAMILTLYKGPELDIFKHLKSPDSITKLLSTSQTSTHIKKNWILGPVFSLLAVATWSGWIIFQGVLCTGAGILVQTWCIRKKGPVFAAAFNPVSTVVVAILEPILFHIKTHVGSIVGAGMVIIGLYCLLWAKSKEAKVEKDMHMYAIQEEDNTLGTTW
ncbi:WAT1-related protein At5g07050-like isoform X2 [Amborella trichopoda]|uniref:WAT1-related protein At5g07050-like isoform X2 n=1 Tax=Amborella trichopoda TaxID=13333 RepID=UPI0009C159D4|nr:WAT1-related protein At5g07050-like isoform X2 [Amborella trichopoda]|eukprot:XP_020524449.1 WAT1-related protein At5g07050-like isoform X2 [Amborella trichopoda]